jgi:hypothetical protein
MSSRKISKISVSVSRKEKFSEKDSETVSERVRIYNMSTRE